MRRVQQETAIPGDVTPGRRSHDHGESHNPPAGHVAESSGAAASASVPETRTNRLAYLPSIYGALLLTLLTLGGVLLLARLQFLLILLFMSVLVACGIAGPVRRLERAGLGRGPAILIVYAAIGAVLAGIGWYALPRLVGQAGAVAQDLPEQIVQAQQVRNRLLVMQADYPILGDLDARLLALAEDAGASATNTLLALPGMVAKTVFAVTSILTLAFLLLLTWRQIKATILSLIHPVHRTTTEQVLAEIGERLGAYLRAKVIIMVIVGAWTYASLALLGSPYAVLAAIFAGTMEALPRIGPWIGRAAIVLAALPLGWRAVAIAVVAHVMIENIKGYGLSPLIEGSQVDIHPLTAFIAVIAGGLLLGWVGALVAVPAAAVVQVIVEDVLIPWRRRQVELAERAFAVAASPD
ncbi:MAG TPA: AI-2E family transporter [Thermomicrobiales bacterium]|nr:AI-2E family transporter [Thermomicrobiales bacterium]